MSCGCGTLIDDSEGYADTKVPFCNLWDCETCCARKRRRCEWEVRRGKLTRFLTLTIDPALFPDPWAARAAAGPAIPELIRRLSRRTKQRIAYWCGVERCESGWPHFHLALRCKFIPKRWIEREWGRLGMGMMVRIRKVYSVGGVAVYMNKYFAKGLARYMWRDEKNKRHVSKRYWKTRDWILPEEEEKKKEFVPRFRYYTRAERVDVIQLAASQRIWDRPLTMIDGVIRLLPLWGIPPPPGWFTDRVSEHWRPFRKKNQQAKGAAG